MLLIDVPSICSGNWRLPALGLMQVRTVSRRCTSHSFLTPLPPHILSLFNTPSPHIPLPPHTLSTHFHLTPFLTIRTRILPPPAAAALSKLQSEHTTQKNSYDVRVTKYESDYKTLSGEWEGLKKTHESHLVTCRASSTAAEKRIVELESQLKTSQTDLKKCQTEHTTHLTSCTTTSAQATKRIAELEGQLATALVAAKTSQTEHSSHLLNCTAASAQSTKRILELEAQLTTASAQATKDTKRIAELENQQKKTRCTSS